MTTSSYSLDALQTSLIATELANSAKLKPTEAGDLALVCQALVAWDHLQAQVQVEDHHLHPLHLRVHHLTCKVRHQDGQDLRLLDGRDLHHRATDHHRTNHRHRCQATYKANLNHEDHHPQ